MSTASPNPTHWSADWEVAVRVWIERHGQTMLAEGLADLLAAIERTQSISAAARALGISYRHAWKLVDQGNTAAGEPLVTAAVGGTGGGGAQLTPRGKLSLTMFDELRTRLRQTAASLLQQAISPSLDLNATIHLAAAISLQEVVGQLLTEYALKQPGVRVRAVFGASNELADHVLAGAPCDVFISADPIHLDRLSASRCLRDDSRSVVAMNSLAVIGPETSTAMKHARDLLRCRHLVLADPASPLGKCSRDYLEREGIYQELLPKTVLVDNSRGILAAIRTGRAEAGIAFASDAAQAAECRTRLAIDPAQAGIAYSAAICTGQREVDSQALLNFLTSPLGQRCFRRCGLTLPRKKSLSKKGTSVED